MSSGERELTKKLKKALYDIMKPMPKLTLSQWADAHRMLSAEASAEPGRWSTGRAEYLREIMNTITGTDHEHIVVMASSQVGKSEILLNTIGYYIHQAPSPILMIQPTVDTAGSFSKVRIAPMIRDTKSLSALVSEPKSRDGSNTILEKMFPGGSLTLAGSNAPSQLSSRPIRVLLLDEVDRFPLSAGTEGSPVALGIQRTQNFYNRKIVQVSTPTTKSISAIEASYETSDQRKYNICCTHCNEYFAPEWRHVKWERDESGQYDVKTAKLFCPHCQYGMTNAEKDRAVRKGKWVAMFPGRRVAGFHLNALVSPWVRLDELVEEWLKVQTRVEMLKAFVNTKLGLSFEETIDDMSDIELMARREEYDEESLPNDIVMLTAGVDVQKDRIECEVVGWGVDDENWNVEYFVIHGDPSTQELWRTLKDRLTRRYKRNDGFELDIAAACIDSGGLYTQQAYAFARNNVQYRFWAIKGQAGNARVFPKKPTRVQGGNKVYIVGVDPAKELLYSWLRILAPGPGYCHFPVERDGEYFSQLTAERRQTKFKNGFAYVVWYKPPHKANEALDCRVYAYAAKVGLNVNILAIQKRQEKYKQKKAEKPEEKQIVNDEDIIAPKAINTKSKKVRPRGGWISSMVR